MKFEPLANLVSDVSQSNPADLGRSRITYLDISSVDNGTKRLVAPQRIPANAAPSRARQLVRRDDVLVSTVRPNLNAVALVPAEFADEIASTGFCVLRPQPEQLSPQYLFYFTQSTAFVTHLTKIATGASYPAVTDNDVLEIRIPLQDLSEQKRIGTQLDQADQLRHTRRYALELTDSFLSPAFLEFFGDPIENPHGFRVELLEDLIQPTRPISYGILMPGPDVPTGVPYIRVTDIQDGHVATALVRRTTREIDQAYKRSKLKAGDLLLSIRGHVGRMAIVPACLDGANITQDTARLATVDTLETRYLMGCLASRGMQRRMVGLTRGAAVQGINLGDVKELPIPIPPISRQQKFAVLVERVERLRALQREALRQADYLFASLLHRAFSS